MENLFLIALIPNEELRKKVYAIEDDFEVRFDSKKARKVYPHITLKAPFKCNDNAKAELLSWFSELHISQAKFSIQLNGFGAFYNKNSPVIYINPVVTTELLQMQKELIIGFRSLFPGYLHPVDFEFKPHLTVAYRDLSPAMFKKAWEEYQHKPLEEKFDVEALYLLQHSSIKWNLISTCQLKRA